MRSDGIRADFATTRWSLVEAIRLEGDPNGQGARKAAMDSLVLLYWPPVFGYLRKSGFDAAAAEELVQEFFASKVLENGLFEKARREKGRLRDFVKESIRNHVRDAARRGRARGSRLNVPLDQLAREEELVGSLRDASPETYLDRRWLLQHLQLIVDECERYWSERRKPSHWAMYYEWRILPAISCSEPPSQAELSTKHGFSRVAGASVIQQVRGRLIQIARDVVGRATLSAADRDEELRELQEMLR